MPPEDASANPNTSRDGTGRVSLSTVWTVAGRVVIDGDALVIPISRDARNA